MTAPLYDVELGLREAAKARRRRDEGMVACAQLADMFAANLARHFGPEALETAGMALVIAGASLGGLATQIDNPTILANVLAFAGQRLVVDARAADEAAS